MLLFVKMSLSDSWAAFQRTRTRLPYFSSANTPLLSLFLRVFVDLISYTDRLGVGGAAPTLPLGCTYTRKL